MTRGRYKKSRKTVDVTSTKVYAAVMVYQFDGEEFFGVFRNLTDAKRRLQRSHVKWDFDPERRVFSCPLMKGSTSMCEVREEIVR